MNTKAINLARELARFRRQLDDATAQDVQNERDFEKHLASKERK
jgi:hypothetical protein